MGDVARNYEVWPELHVASWSETKRNLHLYAQMLGKMRVALSPPQPNWMFTALYLSARGLTTGFIPYECSSFEATIDVFDSTISVARSDGRRRDIALLPVRSVAEIYSDVLRALRELGISCNVSPVPQELPDATPFHRDERIGAYDPAAVGRWFRAATATVTVFERWRARFFGRSGIQVWWGALDVALLLFSGKRVAAPSDRGYLMKYDLDAELMNVGLYLGDDEHEPFFYGYIYPEPPRPEELAVPSPASWSTQLREWTLPYAAVRDAEEPRRAIAAFIDVIYEECFAGAAWEREAYIYDAPKAAT
jgi:hypothetical protein